MSIRQIIREKRRALSPTQRLLAEQQILHSVIHHHTVLNAQHIALYLAFDGEVNTQPIIESLWQKKKSVYLPVIHPFSCNHLLFLNYNNDTILVKNQFGILQPKLNLNDIIPYQQLDIIFTPLVAFDNRGYRIGMGKGYYDRMLKNHHIHNITALGLAFQCQKIERVNNQRWDIPLTEIIYA